MLRNVKVNVEILESLKRVSLDFRVHKKEVKPMERIRTIYREVFSKSPAALGADQSSRRKLSRRLKNEKEEQDKPSQKRNGQIWYLPAAVTGRYMDLKVAFSMLWH